MRRSRRLAIVIGACVVAASLSACGAASSTYPKGSPGGQPAAIGTSLSVNDGTGDSVKVTLLTFENPATAASAAEGAPAGEQLDGVLVKVTGVTGTFQEAAGTAVALLGTNGHTYAAGAQGLVGCSLFPAGQIRVTVGKSVTGCVAVPITKGVKVAKIEFDAGYVGTTGDWAI